MYQFGVFAEYCPLNTKKGLNNSGTKVIPINPKLTAKFLVLPTIDLVPKLTTL